MTYGFYLYGICPLPAPENLNIEGLDKEQVKTQVVDGLAILYSIAQQKRYLASRRNLLGHEKVLEQVMSVGYRYLLPLQFGLTVSDWDTLTQQLIHPYRQRLEELLEKISGYREVGVKVFWDKEQEIQRLLAEQPEIKNKRDSLAGAPLTIDAAIQIGQAIEGGLGKRQQHIQQIFQAQLNPLAVEVVENELQTEGMIYNCAYLIPWDRETEFSEVVETLDLEFDERLRIRYNDFTAPFNFARLEQVV